MKLYEIKRNLMKLDSNHQPLSVLKNKTPK